MKFIKTCQLILMGTSKQDKEFVEVPGYLYHYKRFGIDWVVHHKIVPSCDGYYMERSWKVSDISTGLSISGSDNFFNTRKEAVEYTIRRINSYSLGEYNSRVLDMLAQSPPHKANWMITSVRGICKNAAVKVQNDS